MTCIQQPIHQDAEMWQRKSCLVNPKVAAFISFLLEMFPDQEL